MNISVFACGKDVFVNYECINGYAFKIAQSWDKCAVLALIRPVKTAITALAGVFSAHFSNAHDCFECLSPHNITT